MLELFMHEDMVEAGCDEAGRGCLAGPVFAAAVIWPKDLILEGLDDSKKINARRRLELRVVIEEKAVAYAVASVDQKEIDEINILQASFKAMHLAVKNLRKNAEHLLIDGNWFKEYPGIPHTCVVKGDAKYASIAAASILAKTYRDEYMEKLDRDFPLYHWEKNKGYPTLEHKMAIAKHGLTEHHRKSFRFEVGSRKAYPFS
jgi:ribonuclease HII